MKTNRHFPLYVVILLLPLFCIQSVTAQRVNGAFIMSSVGSIPNMSNNSMAVNFKSSAICLQVQNGTAVLMAERGNGKFISSCLDNLKINTLGIRMYPNPVVSTTQVKLTKQPPADEMFNWSIWSAEGLKITGEKSTGYEMFQGKTLDLRGLHSGTFILQVESNNYKEILKFVKAR